jgi:hypothetical protein
MSARLRHGLLSPLLLGMLVLVVAGCKKPPPTEETSEQPRPAPAVPTDHVEKGSLAPGKEKAFALPLPLGFPPPTQLDRTAASVGVVDPKQVVTYVKERVRDGKLIESRDGERTVFEGVRLPEEPDRYLQVVVADRHGSTLITVTDVTPPAPLPPTTEAERYKQVGMDPKGRLLHPRTLE